MLGNGPHFIVRELETQSSRSEDLYSNLFTIFSNLAEPGVSLEKRQKWLVH